MDSKVEMYAKICSVVDRQDGSRVIRHAIAFGSIRFYVDHSLLMRRSCMDFA